MLDLLRAALRGRHPMDVFGICEPGAATGGRPYSENYCHKPFQA